MAYNALERFLHRAALQVPPVAELSFDLDQKAVTSDPKDIVDERHVFVSGLARGGTTILMRRFYATGTYRSLTYRNMPFVLAPNLWHKLARFSQREMAAAERAHNDRILVDVDSPESLDEVFWRIFDGNSYIEKTHLKPHSPDEETTWKYVCYVNAILHSHDGPGRRYLSKNNNNILRLASIRRAFPRALILIPFREPLSHASSLARQHRHFVEMQQSDGFVRSYMSWLVHHEFGLDHRPFRFDDTGTSRSSRSGTDEIDYWLGLWCETYRWLERSAPEDVIFVCYEDLCEHVDVWNRLAAIAGVDGTEGTGESFSLSRASADTPRDAEALEHAKAIYVRLQGRARASLQHEWKLA